MSRTATIYSYRDSKMKAIYTLNGAVLVDLVLDEESGGQFDVNDFERLPDEIPEGGFGPIPLEMLKPREGLFKTPEETESKLKARKTSASAKQKSSSDKNTQNSLPGDVDPILLTTKEKFARFASFRHEFNKDKPNYTPAKMIEKYEKQYDDLFDSAKYVYRGDARYISEMLKSGKFGYNDDPSAVSLDPMVAVTFAGNGFVWIIEKDKIKLSKPENEEYRNDDIINAIGEIDTKVEHLGLLEARIPHGEKIPRGTTLLYNKRQHDNMMKSSDDDFMKKQYLENRKNMERCGVNFVLVDMDEVMRSMLTMGDILE